MLRRPGDLKKPTDDAYAFVLRAVGEGGFQPARPPFDGALDIRDTAARVLVTGAAQAFERQVARWDGPEDVAADGTKLRENKQLLFIERPWADRLVRADLELPMRGTVLVLRRDDGCVDYVVRDHHMLDVVLHEYAATGMLPNDLFHADRHSDWCRDSFLEARRPDQAATWWKLLDGLKRPDGAPVLAESAVHFAWAKAAQAPTMSGRDISHPLVLPWFLSAADIAWEAALARPGAIDADWVSIDLDYLQPSSQLAITRGLLRDARFHALVDRARVRVFCLSPQFTNGGDRFSSWRTHGSLSSSLRLVNVLRALPTRRAKRADRR